MQAEEGNMDKKVPETLPGHAVFVNHKAVTEVEEILEEDIDQSRNLEEGGKDMQNPTTNQIEEKFCVSPQVKQALETLEKVISNFREYRFDPQTRSLPGFTQEESVDFGKSALKDSKHSQSHICSNGGVSVDVSKNETVERISHEPRNSSGSHCSRHMGSNSYSSRETNHNRIVPASPEENLPCPDKSQQTALYYSNNETTEGSIVGKTAFDKKPTGADAMAYAKVAQRKGSIKG